MSERLLRLTAALQSPDGYNQIAGQETIEVSKPASTAVHLYEKVRTTIDYQEEHLLRRNAILRIVKRYVGSDITVEKLSENLLRELVWARYLPNKEVPTELEKQLVPIFEKYEPLLRESDKLPGSENILQWLLDVMSTELEYAITPPYKEEALVSYMYEEMRGRINWDKKIVITDEEKDLFLYVAIHRAVLKSNNATLRFRVLSLYYPDWPGSSSKERIDELRRHLDTVVESVERVISHPVTAKLMLLMRRKAGVFRIIRNTIEKKPEEFASLLNNPDVLDKAISRNLKKHTKNFRQRLRRTVLRAVLFLFITKMFLALIIELPYDLLIAHETSFIPLLVNILFHPILLAFIGLTIVIKEKQNSADYTGAVRALSVGADHDLLNVRMKAESFNAWSKIFGLVYTLMFFFTYGIIATLLVRFDFNWLSALLFLFFLSLVTFFGIRIRSTTKDVVLSGQVSGIIGTVFDFFMIPLVRAGRWLSLKVAKINIFIYFFDFIIEAPFKVAVRFTERWVAFVREKKEEI